MFRHLPSFAFFYGVLLLCGVAEVSGRRTAFLDPRPPIGATYEKSVGLPVIGKQEFSLTILSDNTAHLIAKGMILLDELVTYKVGPGGCLNCRLSDIAIKRLRSFRTTLKEVGYNPETDTPYVKVLTPLPRAVRINLKRKSVEEAVGNALGFSDATDCGVDGDIDPEDGEHLHHQNMQLGEL